MELTFQKENIAYLGILLRDVHHQEQTQEIRLSDGMPDIGRVIASWGMPVIRGKEWRRNSIAVSGGVMVWVLYAPEDGTEPRCVESWIPFQTEWDIREGTREGQIRVQPLLRFVDTRSVSARKMMVRTGIAALAEAMVPMQAQISAPRTEEPDIQLLKTTYPVRLMCHMGEKTFMLDEDLVLPDSCPMPVKLIRYSVQPEITEQRISGNRVVFKGNANLHLLYRSEEGQLHTWDFELPFSQLGNLEESLEDDAELDTLLCVTSLELHLDEDGHLRLKCGLVGQYSVSQRLLLELTEDAYGINRDVTPQMEELELPVILENRQENLYGEQSIPQDGNLIVDTEFLPDFPRKRILSEGVELEIPGQFQVLYYGEDGLLQSATARREENYRIPAGEDTQLDTRIIAKGRPDAVFSGGGMLLKSNAVLDITTRKEQAFPMVGTMEVGQPKAPDPGRPSVILCRAGDGGLWKMAKQTGSTMEAIRQANALQGEPVQGQMLLIPIG